MQTGLQGFWKTARRRARRPAGLLKLPPLTAFEQTRRSWARKVETWDEVPEIYRGLLGAWFREPGAFSYAVLTPTYEGFLRRENEKLVCSAGQQLLILEKGWGEPAATCYRLEEISYVEVGTILLQAWITIRGLAGDCSLQSTTLKFNAVTDYMFAPFIRQIRGARGGPAFETGPELQKFDYLGSLNFKFMNFARRSLLPGERVALVLLQPEIKTEILRMWGRSFSRSLFPAHLTILTDRELIIIRDDLRATLSHGIRYGGIWTYIPLDRIGGASLAEQEGGLSILSIHLPADETLELLFSPANRPALELLVTELGGR